MSKVYRINELAKRIGRSAQTVRRWEREGRLTAKRLPSGQRYFDESDVRALLGGSPRKKAMVEDLMAIVHTFSCRLYGLRKYAIANPKAPCE
jgi:predicted site-specific integrase-resolvase